MREEPIEILTEQYGFWNDFVTVYKEKRGATLWESQLKALEEGALNEQNFIMVSSAGSGKTHVAELIIFDSIIKKSKPIIYLAPYNSLVEQKNQDFTDIFSSPSLGLKVSKSTLEDEEDDLGELKSSNIVVMTYERFDYFLRNHPKIISNFGCVIVDEFHMIGDNSRGPSLEIVVSLMRHKFPEIKLVGLSAVVPNVDEIALWLNSNYCNMGNWRKNPLHEGVFDAKSSSIKFYKHSMDQVLANNVDKNCLDDVCNVIIDFIKKRVEGNNPQLLVFTSTRKKCVDIAKKISQQLEKMGHVRNVIVSSSVLDEITAELDSLDGRDLPLIKALKQSIHNGVAFHHAGLNNEIKRIIEREYERGNILVLVSTTTLAAGINLPAKRVIVTEPKVAQDAMSVSQYKNIAGRAGRPKYTNEPGECVLMANSPVMSQSYLNNYVLSNPEPLKSKLILKSRLDIVLNLARIFNNSSDIIDILDKSLYGFIKSSEKKDIGLDVDLCVDYLESLGFLTREDLVLILTELGRSTSKQIIDPYSVYIIVKYLKKSISKPIDDEFIQNILLIICSAHEFDEGLRIWTQNHNYNNREILKKELSLNHIGNLNEINSIMNTVLIIRDWIEGKNYSDIFDKRPIDKDYWGPSDIAERIAPTFSRVIRVIRQIIEESDPELHNVFDGALKDLQYRVLYGIKSKHVPLFEKGILRKRNLIKLLETHNLDNVENLLEIDIRDLSKSVGRDTAVNVKRRTIMLLEEPKKQKEDILIEAFENKVELSVFERLFATCEREFELSVEDIFSELEPLVRIHPHRDQSSSKPEFDGYLVGSDKNILKDKVGRTVKLCIECKSTSNLKKLISSSTSLEVLKKCPDAAYTKKIVIGTPGFEPEANENAKEHNVLLISVSTFAKIVLLYKKGKLNSKKFLTIFSENGELTFRRLYQLTR